MEINLIFIPSPGIGHIRSTAAIAKLLVDTDHRLSITLIVIPSQISDDISSSSYPHDLQGRLRYYHLPPCESEQSTDHNFVSYIESKKTQVRDAVSELSRQASTVSNSPKLAGIVVDMFCTSMIDIADEFSLPVYTFYTSNVSYLGLQFHVQSLYEEKNLDVSEFHKDLDVEFDVPTLTRPFPAKCLPSVMLNKEFFPYAWLPVVVNQVRRFRETKGILVNTFAELEPTAMRFLSKGDDKPFPTVYPVGPVLNLKINGSDSRESSKQSEIIRWLDEQPRKSVVFLCFGSMGGFREEQAKEIAIALERSGHRFVWSLRRAQPKGTVGPLGEFTNLDEILPEGFLDQTSKTGKIIGWAPQSDILSNPAVGGFVSHCGWNSTLESLWFGVPMATWPIYAEQQVNAFLMVDELGLAAEVRNSFRADFMAAESEVMTAEVMTAEEIERGIKCLMEHGSDLRDRVKDMSEKSHVALTDGGSSHDALLKFIQDVTENIS
ncbi:unnamed protein product [Cochlearia groenlandica]